MTTTTTTTTQAPPALNTSRACRLLVDKLAVLCCGLVCGAWLPAGLRALEKPIYKEPFSRHRPVMNLYEK